MSIEINASLLPFLWDFFIEFSEVTVGKEKIVKQMLENLIGKFKGLSE